MIEITYDNISFGSAASPAPRNRVREFSSVWGRNVFAKCSQFIWVHSRAFE